MTLVNEISKTDWQLSVAGFGQIAQGEDDVNQCIHTILNTVPGTDPFRPTFGSDVLLFIDLPIAEARTKITAEIIRAVGRWERRALIQKIDSFVLENAVKFDIYWTGVSSSSSVYSFEFTPSTTPTDQVIYESASVINPATQPTIRRLNWQLGLEFGQIAQGLQDIQQCILTIIGTEKGSDPFRPTFGSDVFEYISYPVVEAVPRIILAIRKAVKRWEPRVIILEVKHMFANQNGDNFISGLIFSISYKLSGGFTDNEAEIIFGFAEDDILNANNPVYPNIVIKVLGAETGQAILTENEKLIGV